MRNEATNLNPLLNMFGITQIYVHTFWYEYSHVVYCCKYMRPGESNTFSNFAHKQPPTRNQLKQVREFMFMLKGYISGAD